MKKIIDVSAWQGKIHWKKTALQVDMAILRASCGMAEDERLAENARGCRENGVPFGVYHYLMATNTVRAREEADRFYRAAEPHAPAFWVADVEYPPLVWQDGKQLPMNPALYPVVKTFTDRLRQRLGEKGKIIYYGGESVYAPAYGNLGRIAWDGLWIANYSGKPKMAHDLHQYTSSGKVDGIGTRVDLNRLAGEKPLAWWTEAAEKHGQEGMEEEKTVVRIIKPECWHIRAGDGVGYGSLAIARMGDTYPYVATSVTGWLAVRLEDGRIGWISPAGVQI